MKKIVYVVRVTGVNPLFPIEYAGKDAAIAEAKKHTSARIEEEIHDMGGVTISVIYKSGKE